MAEPLRSVLLVDFDSVHRSLTAGGGEAAARLVTRVPGWLRGLEGGKLVGPEERRFALKRAYADPKALGEGRLAFQLAGIEVVDCITTAAGRGVDLLMAMDSLERMAEDDRIGEFVLLSAEPTLAPLLTRLKKHGRRTVIYADTNSAPAYRVLADSVIEIAAFAEYLLTHDAPEGSSTITVDRSEIEGFARRVHAATNIPLFSPRTFAELFRLLTEEIIARGYHFQTTAKNVADRLTESGRSVTRRQVVFIVKGLALKGHVFSITDSPRRLAEVFREQALYLIESAGLKLDDTQQRLLTAWIVDRVPTSVARAPAPPAAASPPPSLRPAASLNGGSRPTEMNAPAASAQTPARPAPAAAAETARTGAKAAEKPAARAGEDDDARPAEPAAERAPAAAASTSPPARPAAAMISPDDARAAIAAKIAQSVRPKPATARPAAAKPATGAPAAPASAEPAEKKEPPQSIENSILAAIAEAVDVLVEDGETEQPKKPVTLPAKRRAPTAPATAGNAAPPRPQLPARQAPAERPAVAARPRTEPRRDRTDDIGDEIQRIIATYNRNRKDEPPA